MESSASEKSEKNINESESEKSEEEINPEKKYILCRRLHSLETCRNSIPGDCIFAHTYNEFTPIPCQFNRECVKPFCRKYHSDTECKCKYLMRMGKCPPYFWNYHSSECIRNELIEWICSEYCTPHNTFCEKLVLIERYHSTYKAVLSILLDSINVRDIHHAIHVVDEFITFPDNVQPLVDTYGISKNQDIVLEFIAVHKLLKG